MQRMAMSLGFVILVIVASLSTIYKWKVGTQVTGIIWSKQFGTDKDESLMEMVIDSQGNIYVVGWTDGNLFGTNFGECDIFIAKFSSDGNLIWGKQLGTPEEDVPRDIAVDPEGNIYVVGVTEGNLFGQLVRKWNCDAFVMKVSPQGEVIWGKQFGTPADDWAEGIDVDEKNSVIYVVGYYELGEYGDYEAEVFEEFTYSKLFVIKYDLEGNKLWERLYGSETKFDDMGYDVWVDENGDIYIVGETTEWFKEYNSTDAFVAKLTSDGNLVWGKQFGAEGGDYTSVIYGKNKNIYIIGAMSTAKTVHEETIEFLDAFIKKYDSNGNQLWLKELRTEKADFAKDIIVDTEENIYIVGSSGGNLFGNNIGGIDIFIVKYNSNGELIWSEMIGTTQNDAGKAIGLDKQGNIYFVGNTKGSLFDSNKGGADIFIIKFKR